MGIKSFGLLYYVRKERASEQTKQLAPIYLRITINGVRAEYNTRQYIEPKKWDSNACKGKGNHPDIFKINDYISKHRARVLQLRDKLDEKNEPISAEILKQKLIGSTDPDRTLIKLFDEHNADLKKRQNVDVAKATYKR